MMSSSNDAGRRFFTTSEVARYCAVTNDGVLKWIKSGKLRAFSTPGGHYRVSSEDFREFLEKYEIPIDEAFFTGQSRTRTVLVVDDEADIRDIVRRVLRDTEPTLRIEEASDGYEAGIKIGQLQPDLIVLDVMMENDSAGYEVNEAVKFAPGFESIRHIPILMVSSIETDPATRFSTADEAPMITPNAYLTKPLDIPRFLTEVSALLGELPQASLAGVPR